MTADVSLTPSNEAPAASAAPPEADNPNHRSRRGFAALTVGAIGVVFGDIGTSPIYALREALAHTRAAERTDAAVFGVISLILWTLTMIVTVKYVIFLLSADNKGEGGSVALMALAQRALGRPSGALFLMGALGVALFYGDGVITPTFSVLSAVEGLKVAPHLGHALTPFVLPTAGFILVALFMVQARGTHRVAALFGPVTILWFITLAALGVFNILAAPRIILAVNPYYAVKFLAENRFVGFIILGSVFLAVTGAEALYADMGHFGKAPIRVAWVCMVFPCLALNYLGQGAFVLTHAHGHRNPFFGMIPHFAYWPVLILATMAAIIASQAVISGAFSMTRQVVQLGLLPRLDIKRTSETQSGQIFVPATNTLMMIGVLILLVVFQTSHNLASAYGVAVTGTMFISTLLAYVVARQHVEMECAQDHRAARSDFGDGHRLPGVEPVQDPRGGLGGARVRRGNGRRHVDMVERRAHPVGEDPRRKRPPGHGDQRPGPPSALPPARHGDVPDGQSGRGPGRAGAQSEAQQGAARAQRDPDRRNGGNADGEGLPIGSASSRSTVISRRSR